MGSFSSILKMLPGMRNLKNIQIDDKEFVRIEAMICSMTKEEREHPEILKASRKARIAKGSGKTNADINRVLKKYEQTKEMMKQMRNYSKGGKLPPNFNSFSH